MPQEKLHLAGYVSGPKTEKKFVIFGTPVGDIYVVSPQLYEPEKEEPVAVFRNLQYRIATCK